MASASFARTSADSIASASKWIVAVNPGEGQRKRKASGPQGGPPGLEHLDHQPRAEILHADEVDKQGREVVLQRDDPAPHGLGYPVCWFQCSRGGSERHISVRQSAVLDSGCFQEDEKLLQRLADGINPQTRIRMLWGAGDEGGNAVPGIIPEPLFLGWMNRREGPAGHWQTPVPRRSPRPVRFSVRVHRKTGGCGSRKTRTDNNKIKPSA